MAAESAAVTVGRYVGTVILNCQLSILNSESGCEDKKNLFTWFILRPILLISLKGHSSFFLYA